MKTKDSLVIYVSFKLLGSGMLIFTFKLSMKAKLILATNAVSTFHEMIT